MNPISRNIGNIPPSEKRSLESLLGQPLRRGQQIFVMAYMPDTPPDKSVRLAARKNLKRMFVKIDRYAKERGITAKEADAALDEAMRKIRPRKP